MAEWALRAETAAGRSDDAPGEALLLRLLGELGPGNQFLVVDRLDAPNDQHYMQIYRELDGTYTIEYRTGAADQHFETVAADLPRTFTVLTGWASGSPDWREGHDWRQWPVP
jgi:tRNA A37 threonylcarbamoyladenosine modification protein TsaB